MTNLEFILNNAATISDKELIVGSKPLRKVKDEGGKVKSEEEKVKIEKEDTSTREIYKSFLRIKSEYRPGFKDVCLRFLKLKHAQKPEYFYGFIDQYSLGHRQLLSSGESKIAVFNQGLARMMEMCESQSASSQVLKDWVTLSHLPPKSALLWIDSLDHLQGIQDVKKFNKALKGYVSLSKRRLIPYHHSYDYALEKLGTERDLLGVEDFLFGLAKEKNLDQEEVEEYVETLRNIPDEARPGIANIRRSTEFNPKADSVLYDLFKIPDSQSSHTTYTYLLENAVRGRGAKSSQLVIENAELAVSVCGKNRKLIRDVFEDALNISIGGYLSSYLRVLDYITNLKRSPGEILKYSELAGKVFEDYIFIGNKSEKNRIDSGKIEEGFITSLRNVESLEPSARTVSLQLTNLFAKKVGKSIRLLRQPRRLYLNQVADYITESAKFDSSKTNTFVNLMLNYEKRSGKVKND
ncbi:MAG: hypothetical protein Q7S74_01135 [Nanoarchaeota archaeon]|nr:hypothetical protein [Nanoarchaeota archaeon]